MAQGIGVGFPIRLGKIGFFEQTFTTLDAAKANLVNLLLTNTGERVMQPDFGADISRLLFEQNTQDLRERLERNIQQSIEFWLPYILIQEINVNTFPALVDENRAEVQIIFSVSQLPNIFETIILQFNF